MKSTFLLSLFFAVIGFQEPDIRDHMVLPYKEDAHLTFGHLKAYNSVRSDFAKIAQKLKKKDEDFDVLLQENTRYYRVHFIAKQAPNNARLGGDVIYAVDKKTFKILACVSMG